MVWQYNPYSPLAAVSVFITLALAVYAWHRRPAPGATAFSLLMAAVSEWSFGYLLELTSADLAAKILWSKVQYVGIVSVPVLWLVFAMAYNGHSHRLRRPVLALLLVVPALVLALAWTNDLHGLMWKSVGLDAAGSYTMRVASFGKVFWLNVAFSYLLFLAGTLLFVRAYFLAPPLYRGQAGTLVVGALMPWIGNAIYLSGASPFPNLDLTPLAFTLAGIAAGWGLFRYRLLDVIPSASDAVLECIGDGVIVLDGRDRIVDINPAAQSILGLAGDEAIGQPAAAVFAGHPDLLKRHRDTAGQHQVIALTRADDQRFVDLHICPLVDYQRQMTGRLLVMRDITLRHRAEAALRESEERLRTVVSNAPVVLFAIDRHGVFTMAEGKGLLSLGATSARIIGRPVTELLGNIPDLEAVFQRALAGESVSRIVTVGPVVFEAHYAPVLDAAGEPAGVIGVGTDVTERMRAEAERERLLAVERYQRGLAETLRDTGLALTAKLDPDEVLDTVLDNVSRVLPYDSANVMLLEDGRLHVKRHRGYEQYESIGAPGNFDVALDDLPNFRRMSESRQPQVIPDTGSDPSWINFEQTRHIRSWVGAPIVVRGQLIGFISLDKAEPGFYTQEMADRLALFSSQAGLALENARMYAEQQRLAITDGLTGLANRRRFDEELARELDRTDRFGHPTALLMVDIDAFKEYNDTYGHPTGDRVLQQLAGSMRRCLRSVDLPARYGGDEFAVILPETDLSQAREVADRLLAQVAESDEAAPLAAPSDGHPRAGGSAAAPALPRIQLSIGIAVAPSQAESPADLIQAADTALYRAKQSGGGLPVVYEGKAEGGGHTWV